MTAQRNVPEPEASNDLGIEPAAAKAEDEDGAFGHGGHIEAQEKSANTAAMNGAATYSPGACSY